jgi:U3 small nucleolar RNA-associated protein 21
MMIQMVRFLLFFMPITSNLFRVWFCPTVFCGLFGDGIKQKVPLSQARTTTMAIFSPIHHPQFLNFGLFPSNFNFFTEQPQEFSQDTRFDPVGTLPLASGLLTLTDAPPAAWKGIEVMDVVRQRNRPKKPPRKPKAAPFFLPTIEGVDMKLDVQEGDLFDEEETNPNASRVLGKKRKVDEAIFDEPWLIQCLREARDAEDFSIATNKLKTKTPAAVDGEIRQLGFMGDEEAQLGLVLDFFVDQLEKKTNFDLVQAYLAAFLNVHGDELGKHATLLARVARLKELQVEARYRLEESFHANLCLLGFLSEVR